MKGELGRLLRRIGLAFAAGLAVALAIAAMLAADTGSITAVTGRTRILYPAYAMFLLAGVVLARMAWLRIGAVVRGEMDVRFYRTFSGGEEPEAMKAATRHFTNLFEMPVLFYVGVLLAFVTHQVTPWTVGLAWAYVLLRVAHAWIHLGSNDVPLRLAAYAASGFVLLVLWSTLFVELLTSEQVV